MEQQRHLEPAGRLYAYRHVRSSEPRRGAASRIRSRLGLPESVENRGAKLSRGYLPSISCLAKELCALRGFDIQTHGELPSGGTILSVDSLNFDRALVLLNLFEDARVYLRSQAQVPESQARALSLRRVSNMASSAALPSIVSDLASERAVIMSAEHWQQIQSTRALVTPARRGRVEFGRTKQVQVLFEV